MGKYEILLCSAILCTFFFNLGLSANSIKSFGDLPKYTKDSLVEAITEKDVFVMYYAPW